MGRFFASPQEPEAEVGGMHSRPSYTDNAIAVSSRDAREANTMTEPLTND